MKIKFLIRLCVVILFIFFILEILKINCVYADSSDVYDVILFWGQSNMVGYCGAKDIEKEPDVNYNYEDQESVQEFSRRTGIDVEILKNMSSMHKSNIVQVPNTVYEYNYLDNTLNELNENSVILGQRLKYNIETGKLEKYVNGYLSLESSYGSNMIQKFCETYYKNMGHKVIVVFAAFGGQTIDRFLPYTDEENSDTKNRMIYESIVEKYNSALNYMNDNNYKIGNRLYVVFQGGSNASSNTTTEKYKEVYMRVHNNIKNDLGISKGAIIYTSMTNAVYYDGIPNVHLAQEQLVNENEDIILGSSYAYDRYVPTEEIYNSEQYVTNIFVDENGNKLPYEDALKVANYSMCPYPNNIHLTSAALSQIGKEAAEKFSKIVEIEIIKNPTKMIYYQNYDELDVSDGELKITYNNGTEKIIGFNNSEVKISGFDNVEIGRKKLDIDYRGCSSELYIDVIPKGKELEQDISFITGLEPNMLVEKIMKDEKFSDYNIKIYDEENNEISSENTICTGNILKIINKSGILLKEYKIVVYGDTNGDSDINSADALMIIKNKIGMETFKNGIYEEAGRVTNTTRESKLIPNACDALAIVKHKLNIEQYKINQSL